MSSKKSSISHLSEEGRQIRKSLEEFVDEGMLELRSRCENHEQEVQLKLGNIEKTISQIQQKLSKESGKLETCSNISLLVDNATHGSKPGSNASSRRDSLHEGPLEWISFHGLDVKLSYSEAELKRLFQNFLREVLGLTWEQIKSLKVYDLICLEGYSEGKVYSTQLFVGFDSECDLKLLTSRSAVAKIQGYEIVCSKTSNTSNSENKNRPKSKRKTLGYEFFITIRVTVTREVVNSM